MKNIPLKTITGGILIAGSTLLAQVSPKPSPFPAEQKASPAALAKPAAAPFAFAVAADHSQWLDQQDVMDKAAKALEKAQEKLKDYSWQDQSLKAAEAAAQVEDRMLEIQDKISTITSEKVAQQLASASKAYGVGLGAGFGTNFADMKFNLNLNLPLAQVRGAMQYGKGNEETAYRSGQAAIDSHHYEQALENFTTVISRNGTRTEGALYWKAYALNKLGRRDEAQAAINQLRSSYPKSSWLDEAKALEVEVKASSGRPVSPEAETDEDIKILALNGLMQSDPEKAIPQIESLLKTSHSPKLKKQAVFVLGSNSSPRARQALEQIARSGNPDLQLAAISYLGRGRNDTSHAQLFSEIYATSSDNAVKRAIVESFKSTNDKEHLVQIVKTEKDQDLRNQAIDALGNVDGQPELWQAYPSESTLDGKLRMIRAMQQNGNLDKLTEIAKTDKEPKVRLEAVRVIASQKAGNPSAALVSIYSAEQDAQVKRQIVNQLAGARNGKALVDIARTEKDRDVKLQIVEQLSRMTKYSKEANDYLAEILSK